MKETRLLKITVKGKTKQEIKDQFKLMTEFCDVEVEVIGRKVNQNETFSIN